VWSLSAIMLHDPVAPAKQEEVEEGKVETAAPTVKEEKEDGDKGNPDDGKKRKRKNDDGEVSVKMRVTRREAGAIMGKRGEKVKELKGRSGASISFRGEHRDKMRNVVITGTEEAVKMARAGIEEVARWWC
jgi:hypothetical protein